MSNDRQENQTQRELVNENDEIWSGGNRHLEQKLDRYYGVEGLRLCPDWYDEERDELLYDALVHSDGGEEQLVAEDVPVYGHGPSGAAGVKVEDLPDGDAVKTTVEGDSR